MKHEEHIVKTLCSRFPFLENRVYIQKEKRIFTNPLSADEFKEVIRYAHNEMDFYRSTHVVGTDDGNTLGLLYILANQEEILLALRKSVPKENPVVQSISDLYPSIVLHERELVDLFGVVVIGLPEGPAYPLPDGWPKGNYPMRKDWNPKYFNKSTMQYEPPQTKEEIKNE
ncbi:MAG TPA: proton-conducting membrane transporter [Clostridiales bacterium]|jgi:Ni,Fe-hydrogenase III component G|nr:proton-conducting membrane transporter [Clostridiales bacterium]HCG34975.1 proton-conducting membrane transporter [Clostridiales bacterium]